MLRALKAFFIRDNQRLAAKDSLFKSVTHQQLIHSHQLNLQIDAIKGIVALPKPVFERFYATPLKNLFSICQYSNQDDQRHFVQVKLDFIIRALKVKRGITLPIGVLPDEISTYRDIWNYATFVATFMFDIQTRLMHFDYAVTHPNIKYEQRINWEIFSSRLESHTCYTATPNHRVSPRSLAPSFLALFFDRDCLNWLYSNKDAYQSCIVAMVNPFEDLQIGPVLKRTYELSEPLTEKEPSLQEQPVPTAAIAKEQEPDLSIQDEGKAFAQWLHEGITQRTLETDNNKSMIFNTPAGIALLSPGIFKIFAELFTRDWKKVQNGFLKLKLHEYNSVEMRNVFTIETPFHKNSNVVVISAIDKLAGL